MARRDRSRLRQTYPGPNPEDNQQMLQDIKDTIESHSTEKLANQSSSPVSDREMRSEKQERPESRDGRERERRSPPSDREQASPGSTPRAQQNRSTPTKQLTQSSDRNKQQLRDIRRSLRPYHRSDPGLHSVGKEQANKTMLEQLISLGHSEVRDSLQPAKAVLLIIVAGLARCIASCLLAFIARCRSKPCLAWYFFCMHFGGVCMCSIHQIAS